MIYKKFQLKGYGQGTTYQLTYYATDSIVSKISVDSILHCIDTSMSLYLPSSLINRFNLSSRGVRMDPHFQKVILKSLETYHRTHGLFDVTVEPLVKEWGFGSVKPDQIPDSARIRFLIQCVGSLQLQIKKDSLIKKKSCVRIDLNGIAQGYTVDVISKFLEKKNISNYLVELGGEIRTKGRKQPGNIPMKIGIEAPGNDFDGPSMLQKIVTLENAALTTSGNYRRYYESAGKKISHLIDPVTGYPSQNDLISVTVYAKDAITADAYDNALMLMGMKQALEFTESRKDIGAYFIYRKSNGSVADTFTSKFRKLIR
ncbi:MAG TPA: FAD:protein FMN transferase [Flavitalea sp.]|nr:FAD:protein FMN transferase [Flavitalea sp.]